MGALLEVFVKALETGSVSLILVTIIFIVLFLLFRMLQKRLDLSDKYTNKLFELVENLSNKLPELEHAISELQETLAVFEQTLKFYGERINNLDRELTEHIKTSEQRFITEKDKAIEQVQEYIQNQIKILELHLKNEINDRR